MFTLFFGQIPSIAVLANVSAAILAGLIVVQQLRRSMADKADRRCYSRWQYAIGAVLGAAVAAAVYRGYEVGPDAFYFAIGTIATGGVALALAFVSPSPGRFFARRVPMAVAATLAGTLDLAGGVLALAQDRPGGFQATSDAGNMYTVLILIADWLSVVGTLYLMLVMVITSITTVIRRIRCFLRQRAAAAAAPTSPAP